MTNEFRVGYGYADGGLGGNTIGNTIPTKGNIGDALADISIRPEQGNPILEFGPPTNMPQGNTLNNYQIQDTWNYVHGKSQWKAGVNFTHYTTSTVFLRYYNGAFNYAPFTNTSSTNATTPDCTVVPGGSLTAFAAFACNIPTSINIADGNSSYKFL